MDAARHRIDFIESLFFRQQVACRSSSGGGISACPTMKGVDAMLKFFPGDFARCVEYESLESQIFR